MFIFPDNFPSTDYFFSSKHTGSYDSSRQITLRTHVLLDQYKDFILRKASGEDIPALIDIIKSVFDEYGWVFVAEDELPDFVHFERVFSDPSKARLFALEKDGKLVGCAGLKFNDEGPYLSRVYLLRAYRGQGLGKWMSRKMVAMAMDEGYSSVHLWTDTRFIDAHHMYLSIGFRMTRELRSLHDTNNSFEWKMVFRQDTQ